MKKKLYLLADSPFSKRDYERFGIGILRERFKIEVLDFTSIIAPKFYREYAHIVHDFPEYKSFSSEKEAINYVLGLFGYLIIDILSPSLITYRIRKIVKKNKCKLFSLRLGLLPNPSSEYKSRLLKLFNLRKLTRYFYNKIIEVVQPAPDYVVVGGEALKDGFSFQTELIKGHSFDYDIILSIRSESSINNNSYFVYLDEDMVYHSDYKRNSIKAPATHNNFYPSINKFLFRLEKISKSNLVVALHPRINNDQAKLNYPRMSIVSGDTARLVKNAAFVVAHASTSLSFAAFWEKPILFLTSKEVEKSWLQRYIQGTANYFDSKVINIDKEYDEQEILDLINNPNREAAQSYVKNFVKFPASPEKNTWLNFCDRFAKQTDHPF